MLRGIVEKPPSVGAFPFSNCIPRFVCYPAFMLHDLTPQSQIIGIIVALTMFAIKVWELHQDGRLFKKDFFAKKSEGL